MTSTGADSGAPSPRDDQTGATSRSSGAVRTDQAASTRPHVNPWLSLTATLIAVFMQLLDVSIVNVALPSISTELGASFSTLQLVITAYTLAFACTLITAARLGDLYGRRKVFLLALASFTIASVLCGIAQSPVELIGARFLQGLTAGMMLAQTLAIITSTFPAEQRGKVFGIYGATIGMATILGPTLGGALISWDVLGLEWRAIFLVNVPLGIIALLFGYRHLVDSRAESAQRLDLPGVGLSVLGLFLVVYPLAEGRERDWPTWLVLMLVASVPVLLGFVLHEYRRGRRNDSPLVELRVFRDRAFSVGCVMALLFFSCLISFFFTISLTLQAGFGFTALHSGLMTLPFALGSAVASGSSNKVAQKLGSRVLIVGAGVLAVGLLSLSVVMNQQGTSPHWLAYAAPLLVSGAGLGLFIAPLQTIILSEVKQEHAGSASGLLPTFQQLGGSVGLAVIGVLFFTFIGNQGQAAVQKVTPELTQQVAASGLPTPAQSEIIGSFGTCAERRLSSADPTSAPPGCEPATAIPGSPQAQVGPALAAAGKEVGGQAFLQGQRRTLWVFSGVLVVVMALALALPRRTSGHGGPSRGTAA
ncbi:MFS transporter [Rhodococcus sp. X156]|uniref:MFS transporter n=1 Tax=Rhodococcus sp. X156 TaxID=2499145 RepID=UPI001F49699A|nr:MFS transporter [Rhodococcus sp. X156]